MKRHILYAFIAIGLSVLIIGGCGTKQEKGDIDFGKAPDFTLLDIDGREVKLSDFKDKTVILDFWATWCPPCRAEIPHFVELYDEYKDKGVEVIGISLDSGGTEVVRRFSDAKGVDYTVLMGDNRVSGLYGGIVSIPTTFVLDKEHIIRKKYIGYRDKEVFERDILELLEEEE